VHARERVEQGIDHHRGEPERQLIHEQEPRVGHQAAAERTRLLLAARQRAGRPLHERREEREEVEDPLEPLRHRVAGRRPGDLEVLAHGQCREQPPSLEHEADAGLDALGHR
jgi:hypothetical protein